MSFLSSLLDRARGLLDAAPAEPTATDVVPSDRFDQAAYQDVLDNVPAIRTMVTDLERTHDYVADFMQDVHNVLAQGDPQIRDAADMATTHVPNRVVIDELSKLPEVQQLRSMTRHDPYAAAMGTVSMRTQLTKLVEHTTEVREAAKQQAEANEAARQAAEAAFAAHQAAAAAQAQADAATGQDEAGNPVPDPNAQQEAQDAANAAQDAANAAEAAMGAALGAADATAAAGEQAVQGMRGDLRAAAAAAADERAAEDDLMRAFGVDDGELKRMSFKERSTLATRLGNNRLAKFAKLIGQFKALQAAESRRKVQHAPDEVNNIVLGDDLMRLAPSELLNLASDELEDDFWMRYVDRSLLCYDLIGNERVGQGPIIVVCDESGSMEYNTVMGGTAEAWSKALALALAEQARAKGRDFYYIGFSSSRQQYSVKFTGGKAKLTDVIDMTEHFFGGGTHYERPLLDALDIVEAYSDADGKKPDIVFITDDEYGGLDTSFMQRWNATKAKYDLRCFGIAMCAGTSGALEAVSDNVRSIAGMTDSDPRVVSDLFRTI